ncbi:MAG: phosphatidylglycerophosphatase A [Desulfovibrionales bacterium]|nr:phosphatidylglycerophosphatase A [Desulfovibrionales bacterium]
MLKVLPRPENTWDKVALWGATLGPAGRMPKAPGTWGSALALLLAWFLFLPLGLWARVLVLMFIFPLGAWWAGRAEKILDAQDPSCVVVDELWGQWLALLFLPNASLLWMLMAFFLFRCFDIIKPWPVRASEHWLPRGWGIMLDDGLAGLYALILLSFFRFVF